MPALERRMFQKGNEIGLFEIGYRTLEGDCHYMLNRSGQLEEVWGEEFADHEGMDVNRVETRSGWYEVDGAIVFAKRIG